MLSVFLTALGVLILGGAIYLVWHRRPSQTGHVRGGGGGFDPAGDDRTEPRRYK